uniref:Astrotactin-2 domain protein n=1 Tax=Siphoviridae sp. ct7BG1 TaxID=2825349 RepID=A0A8S5U4I2_9CAUD|nr:MAG TPA: Astrotactin-2 domain protein [Siphoviridae sp. ct7BG1]
MHRNRKVQVIRKNRVAMPPLCHLCRHAGRECTKN